MLDGCARRFKQTTDLRFRCEFFPWKMQLRIDYNPNVITLEQLVKLIADVGNRRG